MDKNSSAARLLIVFEKILQLPRLYSLNLSFHIPQSKLNKKMLLPKRLALHCIYQDILEASRQSLWLQKRASHKKVDCSYRQHAKTTQKGSQILARDPKSREPSRYKVENCIPQPVFSRLKQMYYPNNAQQPGPYVVYTQGQPVVMQQQPQQQNQLIIQPHFGTHQASPHGSPHASLRNSSDGLFVNNRSSLGSNTRIDLNTKINQIMEISDTMYSSVISERDRYVKGSIYMKNMKKNLSDMNLMIEKVVTALNLSHKKAMAEPEFQGLLISCFNSVNKLMVLLRNTKRHMFKVNRNNLTSCNSSFPF